MLCEAKGGLSSLNVMQEAGGLCRGWLPALQPLPGLTGHAGVPLSPPALDTQQMQAETAIEEKGVGEGG